MERAFNLVTTINTNRSSLEHRDREISPKGIINLLNFLNFQNAPIAVKFRHIKHKNIYTLKAIPAPCNSEEVFLKWISDIDESFFRNHTFEKIELNKDDKIVIGHPEVLEINTDGITICLPKTFTEFSSRTVIRFKADNILVRVIQNGAVFQGNLIDFNSCTFNIHLTASPPQTLYWLSGSAPVIVIFSSGDKTLYSGECEVFRYSLGRASGFLVVRPDISEIRRFKPREFRSARRELLPTPLLSFIHPLSSINTTLQIENISGSGCLVHEEKNRAALFPGLILPDASIVFSETFTIRATLQVVHVKESQGNTGLAACGLATLQLGDTDQIKLLSHLQRADDTNFFICNKIPEERLWNFFFNTGFIYPEKYEVLSEKKEKIKNVYEKLYTKNASIARHFTYERNGQILGHIAMLRLHENSWIIHHHAAQKSSSNKAGLAVLSQISRYVNELHMIYSAHLKYVFCYFRMGNKFPRRLFGGVAEYIADQSKCSLDTFAYFHPGEHRPDDWNMPGQWSINKASPEDMKTLAAFYNDASGGLALVAGDLEYHNFDSTLMSEEYQRSGFRKGRACYSLKYEGSISAIIIVNIADFALNMSDLTNCIQFFAIDIPPLTQKVLTTVIAILEAKHFKETAPILLYPVEAAERLHMKHTKQYTLWTLDLEHLDSYFTFCKQLYKDM